MLRAQGYHSRAKNCFPLLEREAGAVVAGEQKARGELSRTGDDGVPDPLEGVHRWPAVLPLLLVLEVQDAPLLWLEGTETVKFAFEVVDQLVRPSALVVDYER